MARPRHQSLTQDLVYNLIFVASAGMMVVGVTTAVLARIDPGASFRVMLLVWIGATGVFGLFAGYLVRRAVARPLAQLDTLVETLEAEAQTPGSAEGAATEFDQLAQRLSTVAGHLLDRNGDNLDQPPAVLGMAARSGP